jgi:competence ComEA-like helix-hairpin-helix protein
MTQTVRSRRSSWLRGLALAVALCVVSFFTAGPSWAGVNINTASASELQSLTGIGPSKAAAIVAYRSENGAFSSVDSLQGVPGIGVKTVESVRPDAEIGDGATVVKGQQAASSGGAPAANAVNINTASATQLDAMPGIGPSKAAAILADRDAKGPFSSCDELSRVTGVGSKTVSQLRMMCKTAD